MLCSARELKLSEDHGGLLELAADAPLGADVRDVLNLDDHVFTLKLTPNLAHALSVYGVARELSALTGAPLKEPTFAPVQPANDEAEGQGQRARPVRPLLRPRDPQREHQGEDAAVDGRAPRRLRPAQRDARWSTSRTT
jgi:hypothetical protein